MKISYYVNRSLWSLVVMVSLFRTAMPMNQLEEGLSAVSGRHVAGLRYVTLAGLSVAGGYVALVGTYYTAQLIRNKLVECKRRRQIDNTAIERKLTEISQWLGIPDAQGDANLVHAHRWFNWHKEILEERSELKLFNHGVLLNELTDDLSRDHISIYVGQGPTSSKFQPKFVRVDGGGVQLTLPTLEALCTSLDDEIKNIEEFKRQLAEFTRAYTSHLDEYWRLVPHSETIADAFNRIQEQYVHKKVGRRKDHIAPVQWVALKNDFFKGHKYRRSRIIALRILLINQNFQIAYNKIIDWYWKLVEAELRNREIRKAVADELVRRREKESPSATSSGSQYQQFQIVPTNTEHNKKH